MVEVRRRERESTNALARRFTRKIQQSRLIITARGLQFHARPRSKAQKRKDALHKKAQREHYERLRKLGKE